MGWSILGDYQQKTIESICFKKRRTPPPTRLYVWSTPMQAFCHLQFGNHRYSELVPWSGGKQLPSCVSSDPHTHWNKGAKGNMNFLAVISRLRATAIPPTSLCHSLTCLNYSLKKKTNAFTTKKSYLIIPACKYT